MYAVTMHSRTLYQRHLEVYSVYEYIGTAYTCMYFGKEALNPIMKTLQINRIWTCRLDIKISLAILPY